MARVGSLVAESLSGEGLKRCFQFNITVHLFHALFKERGGVVVAQVNESRQLAYLCMVDSKLGATGTGRWKIVKWPAVAKPHMVMEVRLDFEEKNVK